MHPSEKTLQIYKTDNDKLRLENTQLQSKITNLTQQLQSANAHSKQLTQRLEQLSSLYNKELTRNKKPLTRTVHLTQERIQLFSDVEKFVFNYSGVRPRLHELTPSRSTELAATHLKGQGTYVPAQILLDEFVRQHKDYDYTLTLRVFCRQLNLLALQKVRVRQYHTQVAKKSGDPRYASKEIAKVYMYFIPFSSPTQP